MSNRREFVRLALQEQSQVRELCRRFGISAKTGYKWINRYREQGDAGLEERSRRPRYSPRRSSEELEQSVLALHCRYPYWGARKLRALLDEDQRPHHSTVDAILRRHGATIQYGQADSASRASRRFEHEYPNELWQMDFKGHFPLLNAGMGRCHPLTRLDDHSRYALCLEACADERNTTVQQRLVKIVRRYGLPRRISADNGPPWGSPLRGGLTALEVGLMRLGIRVSHSRAYHPQTQGKLERFHQTLKRELLSRTGFTSLEQCQREMDRWRHDYNQFRPHQALAQQAPISRYQPSARAYPEQLPPIEYEPGERVLKVRKNGQIQIKKQSVFVGEGLAGQYVAIRPTQHDASFDIVSIHKTIQHVSLNIQNPSL